MTEYETLLDDERATIEFGRRLAIATFSHPWNLQEVVAENQGVPTIGGRVHLLGELGAGKTTLTRGILRGYGYEGAVKSPTYTLVEPYQFDQCHIYHFDFYRLTNPEEVDYLGTEDHFLDTNLCVIEWADKVAEAIPPADLIILLQTDGAGRRLHCQTNSDKGEVIAKRLWE